MKVFEAMTKKPVTMNQTTSVRDVAQKMREERIGSIVITEDGDLIAFDLTGTFGLTISVPMTKPIETASAIIKGNRI